MKITEGRLRQIIKEEIKRTILKERDWSNASGDYAVSVRDLIAAAKKAGNTYLPDALSTRDENMMLYLRGTNPQLDYDNVKAYWTPKDNAWTQWFSDIPKKVVDQL
jgi:hypothetical protein